MIKINIKSNFINEEKIYSDETTIAEVMEDNNFSLYGNAMTTANGIIITENNADSAVSDFAEHSELTIMSIVKGDGNNE